MSTPGPNSADVPVRPSQGAVAEPGLVSRAAKPLLIALATVAVIAGCLLFKDLGRLGIWDPHELTLADLGCRRAAAGGRLDIASCGVAGGAKATDMRPIVMVQTVAWGFRFLGVSESAGRVPLAIWCLLGALAVTLAVGRLVDARAGLFTGIVLATTPLYLVQGRLILGDAATMASFAIALSGLAVAAFDRSDDGTPASWSTRAPWALAGALGVAAGCGCRGLAVGCAPALAIGLAWLVRTANVDRSTDARAPFAAIVGVVIIAGGAVVGLKLAPTEVASPVLQVWTTRSLLLSAVVGGALLASVVRGTAEDRAERGIVGAALAVGALGVSEGIAVSLLGEGGKFVAAVGAVSSATHKFPTFDLLVRQIAHGVFPWSCFFPFAVGRALARPTTAPESAAREVDLRVTALIAGAICFGVQALAAPRFGLMPFAGAAAMAVVIGVVLRDVERTPSGSLAIAIGTAVLAFLVLSDFNFEDLAKTPVELATAPILEPYGLYGLAAPEELRIRVRVILAVAGVVFLLPIFFVWVDDDPRPGWTSPRAVLRPIRGAIAAWKHPYHGLLLLLLASFEACIAVAGFVTFKRALRRHVPQLQQLSAPQRDLLVNLWWYVLVGAVLAWVAYAAFLYGRDAFRALRGQRVATIAIGGLVAAGVWSYGVMPAVANQFSPKGVFSTYRRIGAGAPIALLGVNVGTAAYDLANATPVVFTEARPTFDWLLAPEPAQPRRFLALRAEQLPELNRLFREQAKPVANLPVLDGRTAQVLLASNTLSGAASQNPLDRMVLNGPPTATTWCEDPDGPICVPSHPIDCDIDGKLRCVGWELMDARGKATTHVTSGERVRLRLIYRVTARVSGGWQVFIHVEQPGTATARKTWDHVPLGSKYAMDNWLPGDVIVDDSEFNLEPNMRSGPPINILTGFFSGSTRMPLLSGPDAGPESEGLRLVLGSVPVR